MPYGWTHEAQLLLHHRWMRYGDFLGALEFMRFLPFSVKAKRDEALTRLNNLRIDVPFSEQSRFSDADIYIDLNHSVPLRCLRQLTTALDFSDRQTEKGRESSDSEKLRKFSNFEDAKVAFSAAVEQLLDMDGTLQIEKLHTIGIFTQLTFEHTFGLVWTA